jgi:hypothetical protein
MTIARPMPPSIGLLLVLGGAVGPVLVERLIAAAVGPSILVSWAIVVFAYGLYPGLVAWVSRQSAWGWLVIAIGVVAPGVVWMQMVGGRIVVGVAMGCVMLVAIGLTSLAMRRRGGMGLIVGLTVGFVVLLLLSWLMLIAVFIGLLNLTRG